MMKKLLFVVYAGLLAMLSPSCTSHYQLTNVSRSRILIDKRYDANPDAKAVAFLAPYKQKVDSVMSPVLGSAAHDMAAKRPESDLSNLLPDIMVWAGQAYGEQPDFGIYNIGGIRAAISKGQVTYGDILDVAPFENKIVFITLTGAKVLELFQQIAKRGGEGVSHGVELVIKPDGKLVSARLHGQEIDPQHEYRIATIDYIAQGNDQMVAFKSGTNLKEPGRDQDNSRFIIMDYFRYMQSQGKAVDSQVEGRITVEN